MTNLFIFFIFLPYKINMNMCLFKRKKNNEQAQQRVVGIIYNATTYTLDDNRAAPKRRLAALAVVEETKDGQTTWELRPVEPIARGREAAFKEGVDFFKKWAFNNEPIQQDVNWIEEKLKTYSGAYLVVL